jgi:hypothetical protein
MTGYEYGAGSNPNIRIFTWALDGSVFQKNNPMPVLCISCFFRDGFKPVVVPDENRVSHSHAGKVRPRGKTLILAIGEISLLLPPI